MALARMARQDWRERPPSSDWAGSPLGPPEEEETLLEALEVYGADMRYECRGRTCFEPCRPRNSIKRNVLGPSTRMTLTKRCGRPLPDQRFSKMGSNLFERKPKRPVI
jgi:hypothetical protein